MVLIRMPLRTVGVDAMVYVSLIGSSGNAGNVGKVVAFGAELVLGLVVQVAKLMLKRR